jgi:hypothetical protein
VSDDFRARLRRLDERWVPRAAHRLWRWRHRTDARGPVGVVVANVSTAMRVQPALAGSIAVVFAAGVLLGTFGTGPDNGHNTVRPVVLPTAPPSALATIGPAPGTAVSVYLTRAASDMRHYGEIAARRPTYAVVDLTHYATPAKALRILGDVQLVRAYVRVPSKLATPARAVPLTEASELNQGLLTAGSVAQATAQSYGALLKALHPKTKSDRTVKRRYVAQRRAALVEATHLSEPARCKCVFAFVVRAGVQALGALTHKPGVRVVDPAPPVVTLSGLTVLPLQPEFTRVVPRSGLPQTSQQSG